MKKKFLIIFVTLIMLLSFYSESFAIENENIGIAPCFTNISSCSCSFGIFDPGEAYLDLTYTAREAYFLQARLEVKIQKRYLLLFWETIDIGEPNNTWVGLCNEVDGHFYESFPIDGAGTYRVVYTLKVFGNAGVTDIYEDTIEDTYE